MNEVPGEAQPPPSVSDLALLRYFRAKMMMKESSIRDARIPKTKPVVWLVPCSPETAQGAEEKSRYC